MRIRPTLCWWWRVRRAAWVPREFAGVAVPAESVLGTPEAAAAELETVLQLARVALAAECVGGAEYVLEMTTDYAK